MGIAPADKKRQAASVMPVLLGLQNDFSRPWTDKTVCLAPKLGQAEKLVLQCLEVRDVPGSGVEWDEDRVAMYEIPLGC